MNDSPVSSSRPSVGHPTAEGLVGISIVGYRNVEDICACLSALEGLTDPDFVVLICENGGRASYEALVAALGRQLRHEPGAPPVPDDRIAAVWRGCLPAGQIVEVVCARDNPGFAGGVNITLGRLAHFPEWTGFWLLNPDTLPHPDALSALIEKARSNSRYGIVGSRLVLEGSNTIQAYGGRWRILVGRGFNIGLHQPANADHDAEAVESEMTYVLGASMYLTRSFIDAVGPMDESYFLYAEEVDWCFRRGSFKLGYADASIVRHLHGTTMGSNQSEAHRSRLSVYLNERNKHVLSRKFFPHLYPLIVVSTFVLTGLYLRTLAWDNFKAALSGWWAGVRGEVGKPFWMRDAVQNSSM